MSDLDELGKAWDDLLDAFSIVKQILKHKLPPQDYDRLKAYGIGNVEAGLGEGDAMPCMYPINKAVENVLESEDEEDEEDEDICNCGHKVNSPECVKSSHEEDVSKMCDQGNHERCRENDCPCSCHRKG